MRKTRFCPQGHDTWEVGRTKYGLCAICKKQIGKKYRAANREKVNARNKAWREDNPEKVKTWYEANREKVCARSRAWRKANPTLTKAWREANPKKEAAWSRKWYETNREKAKANSKAWYEANRERSNITNKAWRIKNRLRLSLRTAARRAKVPPLKKETCDRILSYYGSACVYCGSADISGFDHLIPASQEGPTSFENLAPCCRSCNATKGARPIWVMLGRERFPHVAA